MTRTILCRPGFCTKTRVSLLAAILFAAVALAGKVLIEQRRITDLEKIAKRMAPVRTERHRDLAIHFEELWIHEIPVNWRSERRSGTMFWAKMGPGMWGRTEGNVCYLDHKATKLAVLDRNTGAVVYDQPIVKEDRWPDSNQPLCIEDNRVWVLGSKDWHLDLETGEWAQEEYTGSHGYIDRSGEYAQGGGGRVAYRDEKGKSKWVSRLLPGNQSGQTWIGDINVYGGRYLYKSEGLGVGGMRKVGQYLHVLDKETGHWRYSTYAEWLHFHDEIDSVAVLCGGKKGEARIFGFDAETGKPLWMGNHSYMRGLGRPIAERDGKLWYLSSWYLSVLDPKTGRLVGHKDFGFMVVDDFTCVDVEPVLFWDDAVLVIEECKNAEGGPGHRFHYYKIIGEREVASGEGTDGE